MDCNNARLFLQFARPNGRDLDGPEAAELEAHLAHCSECNALAQGQRRIDQRLGRAMRDVAVPAGLREQILQRLAAERGDWYRRWVGHGLRGVAAVAAVVLLVWGWYVLYPSTHPAIHADEIAQSLNVSPPGEERTNELLRLQGIRSAAPDFVNYAYLVGRPAVATLPGTEGRRNQVGQPAPVLVPQLTFAQPSWTRREGQSAIVYIVPSKQYPIEDLENPDNGYRYRLEIDRESNPDYVYLIFHTGDRWDWLRATPRR